MMAGGGKCVLGVTKVQTQKEPTDFCFFFSIPLILHSKQHKRREEEVKAFSVPSVNI